MPRLRHDAYFAFQKTDHGTNNVGLTQDDLDRLSVWRRRRSSSSSCSSDSTSSEEEEDVYYQRELEAQPCSYKLKDIFGVVRRSTKSETSEVVPVDVSNLWPSTLEAAAAVSHASADLRVASLRASGSELMSAINDAEEDLALLSENVTAEVSLSTDSGKVSLSIDSGKVAKVPKDKENQPPRRKVVRAAGRTSKQRKNCAPARGCRTKQTP
jgi:hypothetical protein